MLSRSAREAFRVFPRHFCAPASNSWFRKVLQRGPAADEPGVFGLVGLHRASDWRSIAEKCIAKCEFLAEQIKTSADTRDTALLYKFDELSNELCIVLDTAELCRNVHPDPAFCRAAEDAYFTVSSMVQNLNADYLMYKPLAAFHDAVFSTGSSTTLHSSLSSEDIHMVKSLTLDFEKGGITLPASEKKQLIYLQEEINRLSSDFTSSVNASPAPLSIPRSKLYAIPKPLRRLLKRSSSSSHMFNIPCDGATVHAFLRHVNDSETREMLYRSFHSFHERNGLPILDKLLSARHQLAGILGKDSYSDLQFQGRLASSPDAVLEFLDNLCHLASPKALKEMAVLETLRDGCTKGQESGPLKASDRPFYVSQAKKANMDNGLQDVAQYLPLHACMNGISLVMKEAFGIRMETEKAAANELWHDSVTKVSLRNNLSEVLGHIFLDLRPRPGKYGHAAHFCIKCGRSPGLGKPYQTPVVALVCTFERSEGNNEPLLSAGEYETLWHEMGHAMHSLLSRTKYQHLSGTRVSTDFVEIPSHVFEHFAWDRRVLERVARHYRTGDPLPTRFLNAMCATRNSFAAIDLQNQARYAAMDLRFHGRNPPVGNTTEVFHDLSNQMTVFPHDFHGASHASFLHLIGYGAGYYSYIFAKVLSAQIWAELFAENPFSITAGTTFAGGLLAHGAAKPAERLIQGILKSETSCDPLLKSLGISEAKSDLTLPLSSELEHGK